MSIVTLLSAHFLVGPIGLPNGVCRHRPMVDGLFQHGGIGMKFSASFSTEFLRCFARKAATDRIRLTSRETESVAQLVAYLSDAICAQQTGPTTS